MTAMGRGTVAPGCIRSEDIEGLKKRQLMRRGRVLRCREEATRLAESLGRGTGRCGLGHGTGRRSKSGRLLTVRPSSTAVGVNCGGVMGRLFVV